MFVIVVGLGVLWKNEADVNRGIIVTLSQMRTLFFSFVLLLFVLVRLLSWSVTGFDLGFAGWLLLAT